MVGLSLDGTLISMNLNGVEYFYIKNLQGDIINIVDSSGNILVEYRYNAWGEILRTIDNTGSLKLSEKNPYRYRGYRYDEETGWYYLNSRYYNPAWGRFINADGLLGEQGDILGHNLYAYCQNNPVMYVDPSGYTLERSLDYFYDNLKIKSKEIFSLVDESGGITKQSDDYNIKSTAFFYTLEILNISSTGLTLFDIGGGLNRTENDGKYTDQWVELVSGNVFAEADIKDKFGIGIFGSLVSVGIDGSIPIPFTDTNFVLGINGHIGAAGIEARLEDGKINVKLSALIGLGFELGFE